MIDQPTSRNGTAADAPPPALPPDPPVDLRRLTGAIRRSAVLIVAIVVVATAAVLALSLLSPVSYKATARVADDPVNAETADTEAADRRLATSQQLATTPTVLAAAARRLPGETEESLSGKVSASVDSAASILNISATDPGPEHAARVANAVATALITERARMDRAAVTQASDQLQKEIAQQRKEGANASTLTALEQQLATLTADEALAGTGVRIVGPATPPTSPYAPKPVRNAVLTFLAALIIAILIAVVRDRARRETPSAQELSQTVGLPLIAALPADDERRLSRRSRAEARDGAMIEEAALQAAIRMALPPRVLRVVLVHGIGHGDSGAQVAVALARSLSWAGHATVLVRLDEPPGHAPEGAEFDVVDCNDVDDQLEELRHADYRYVIVQSPSAAPGAKLRLLAAHTASAVLVARLGVTSVAEAGAARRLVDALGLHGLGLVVTFSDEDAPAVGRTAFAAPLRPPVRSRTTSPNGAPADIAAPAEQATELP
jgi:capsular polysaccharide biosynthesis protein